MMVLHNFLSKRLAPLQDRSHRPVWMYTGVNDIMRLDREPASSLGDALLATSLKALTTDQSSAELVTPAAACEPLCANQAVRIALLAIMPMLDDVDITPIQRGDQSHGVVIPGLGSLGRAVGGHDSGGGSPVGLGGVPVGGGLTGNRSGALTGGRGGGPAGGSSTAPTPNKGKQTCVILDDDEVSSDEDEPLQKWLWQLSGARPVVLDEAVVADKEATDKRAAEEAVMKRVTEERATKEATMKAAATEEVAGKTANEATGAAEG
jgi:hypothetical protein